MQPTYRYLTQFAVALTITTSIVAQDRAPRTEDGHPDLEGVWNFDSRVPLERPLALAGKKFFTKDDFEQYRSAIRKGFETFVQLTVREATGLDWVDDTSYTTELRSSLITYPEDGRLPANVDGVQGILRLEDLFLAFSGTNLGPSVATLQTATAVLAGGRKDSHLDFIEYERCIAPAEVPFVPKFDDNYVQIVQSPDFLVILMESDRRIVSLGTRAPVSGARSSSIGTSSGHWEGETLVVETRDFKGQPASFAGVRTSDDKVVTERFTRTARNTITYSATVVDPKTFRDRVEVSFPLTRTDSHLYESACHEGNRSLSNMLSAARKEDEKRPRQQLTVFDRNGTIVTRVGEAGVYSQAAFSPDGSRLAVIGDGSTQDVWVIDIATGLRTVVTSDAFQDRAPVWSPDGRRIAYVSIRDYTSAIYQRASNGQGGEEMLYRPRLGSGRPIVLSDWSPDGRFLCFWSGNAMFLLPVLGDRKPIFLGAGDFFGRSGRFSPDGRLLAFSSNTSGQFEIYVKEIDADPNAPSASPRVQVSSNGGVGGIVWRRDGKELYYFSQGSQAIVAVEILNRSPLQLSAPRELFRISASIDAPDQLSSVGRPDGEGFVFPVKIPLSTTGR